MGKKDRATEQPEFSEDAEVTSTDSELPSVIITEEPQPVPSVVVAPPSSLMALLDDSVFELHAIKSRFEEIIPMLPAAIAMTEGELHRLLLAFSALL